MGCKNNVETMYHAEYVLPRTCDNVKFPLRYRYSMETLSTLRVAYGSTRTRLVHRNANDGVARAELRLALFHARCNKEHVDALLPARLMQQPAPG